MDFHTPAQYSEKLLDIGIVSVWAINARTSSDIVSVIVSDMVVPNGGVQIETHLC